MKKIILIIILLFELFIVIYSKEVIKEFTLTINICLYALMPTMFFQIFFSNILVNIDIEKYLSNKICNIFNINKKELSIILLSIFSGYPNNIRLLNKSSNEYLNYSTNYINPLFILVTVGSIYLKNIKLSLIIYLSHVLSNIIMLYLLKNKHNNEELVIKKSTNLFNESIMITIKSLSIIFSNLLLISLLVTFVKVLLPTNVISSMIIGLIEFSRGTYEISYLNLNLFIKGLLILIIITFGSISIHFQAISLNSKIKYIKFLLFRILNVLISVLIYILMYQFQ